MKSIIFVLVFIIFSGYMVLAEENLFDVSCNDTTHYQIISKGGESGDYQAFPDACRLQNGDIMVVFYEEGENSGVGALKFELPPKQPSVAPEALPVNYLKN